MTDHIEQGDAVEYGLLVSFPDQSESFVNGFEAGALWQRLGAEVEPIDTLLHVANLEVALRMATNLDWRILKVCQYDAEWAQVLFEKNVNKKAPYLRAVS